MKTTSRSIWKKRLSAQAGGSLITSMLWMRPVFNRDFRQKYACNIGFSVVSQGAFAGILSHITP